LNLKNATHAQKKHTQVPLHTHAMGKSKKKTRQAASKQVNNPVGIISVQDAASMQSQQHQQHITTPPVVKNLDSTNPNEREQSCQDISYLVLENNGEHIDLLIKAKAINKLIQKLCDPFKPVRAAAAGALRNLTIVGGPEICDLLVKNDILTTISAAVVQALQIATTASTAPTAQSIDNHNSNTMTLVEIDEMNDEQSEKQSKAETKDPVIDEHEAAYHILVQIMILLSFICENSDLATSKVTNGSYAEHPFSHYFTQMISHPNIIQYYPQLVKTTLNTLNIITDENLKFNNQLNHYNIHQILMNIIQSNSNDKYLKVLACSVLLNLNTTLRIDLIKTVNIVFPVLRDTLGLFDGVKTLVPLLHTLQIRKDQKQFDAFESSDDNFEDDNDDSIFSGQYVNWKANLQAQRMSFEILANVVNALNQQNQPQYDDFNDEDENQEDDNTTVETPKELAQFFEQSFVFNIVLDKCIELSQQGDLESLQQYSPEIQLLNSTLLRGLSCLNNMVLAMDQRVLAKYDVLKLWNFTFELCNFTKQKTQDLQQQIQQQPQQPQLQQIQVPIEQLTERLEELSGILWTVLRSQLLQQQNHSALVFNGAQLFAEISNHPSENIRMNSIGILAELGKIPHDAEKNNQLAILLSQKLSESSLLVLSEVLNAVFDIFGDEKYDQVLVQSGLLKRLQVVVTLMQHRITQSHCDRAVILRAKEARLNLQRYLKYKATLLQ
jgi:hypothetical protein